MASNVEGEIFGYVALRSNLLEGIVEVLVAGDRKDGLRRICRGKVRAGLLRDPQGGSRHKKMNEEIS